MSHLSTIISRIEQEIERHDDPMETGMMQRHLKNLREYPSVWDDATDEELERRQEILDNKPYIAESHWQVDCMNDSCEFSKQVDSEHAAREIAVDHEESYKLDAHTCFWEHVVEIPARDYNG